MTQTLVETHGVDMIPPAERVASPRQFLWIWLSAQFSFGIVVLGSLPILFGLGWWAAVTAILAGLLLGTLVFAPLVRFGKRTGANDPVSSGAHFGVRGRVVANVITLVVALGFFAIAVWTGATAIMTAGQRLLGLSTGKTALAITMPVVALAVILAAIYGYRTLMATYKVMTAIGGAVILLLIVVLWPQFDATYPGGNYILGDFWRTWLLAVSFAATLPISYSTFQGDYSRYLSPQVTDRAATWWNGIAMYLSNAIALLAGAFVTTVFTDQSVPWIIGTAAIVPLWFAVVVVLFGLIGTLPQGALCIYAAGLSANSILWRASRITSTLVVSALGLAMLYLGAIVYDAVDSISAFVVIILILVSPWTAIMLVGFRLHRGDYEPTDLYAFTTGGGRYWYTAGLNPRALLAFIPAVILGLLFASNSLYTGPLANLAGGIDLSLLVPFLTGGALYFLLCQLFPEHPRSAT